jgi:hypothetical protein
VFNRIVEDTVAHITSSVLALDSGYVILTGTVNEFEIRSFALRSIDLFGNVSWKEIYDDETYELWEGYSNCLKRGENSFSSTGVAIGLENDSSYIFMYEYDTSLYLFRQISTKFDISFKRSYNQIMSRDKYFYIIGQSYDEDLENYQLLAIKVDTSANTIWEKSYGNRYEAGIQIIETSDKNILIGGLTFSFPTTVTDEDWYLIKLDTAGNVIWQNGFGRPGFLNYDGAVAGLIETKDSNYVACGGYPALRSDCDTYHDGCLRKISKDGDLMWERFYRSYFTMTNPVTDWFENYISSVAYKNNYLFIIGSWRSGIGRQRGYLQKITEDGNICWNREYFAIDNTTNDQYFVSFQPTADTGFIIAGYGNNYDSYGYNPAQQAWLVKTDSLGIDGLCYTEPPGLNIDIVLPETINCSDTITVYAYIAGKSAPYTIETSVGQVIDSIYYPPLFVPVEIGLSQTEITCGAYTIYTQQITEATLSNHEWGQCIAKPIEFYTPHTSGSQQINITVTDAYGESKTITKEVFVNDCGSGIAKEEVNYVNVYPNPAVDNLYLYIGDFEQVASTPLSHLAVNCEIYNSLGQLVKTMQLSNDLTVINVKDFARGMYVLKINYENKTYSLSFEKK